MSENVFVAETDEPADGPANKSSHIAGNTYPYMGISEIPLTLGPEIVSYK